MKKMYEKSLLLEHGRSYFAQAVAKVTFNLLKSFCLEKRAPSISKNCFIYVPTVVSLRIIE
jgi:hypothetical protein